MAADHGGSAIPPSLESPVSAHRRESLLPAMLVATFASLAFFFWRAYQLK
jgi:hypothetical protein